MKDERIVDLYWQRDPQAIEETEIKYGRYCFSVAYNILANREDAEESVNDTYMGAWNSMPTHRPALLSTYLAQITRRFSIGKLRRRARKKRGGGEMALALEELSECVPASTNVEAQAEANELQAALRAYVKRLPEREREVFIARYWFLCPVSEICEKFGYSESKVKSMLSRSRKKLRGFLETEGLV